MKMKHLALTLLLAAAGAAQALPQYQIHAEYLGGDKLDVKVTFSGNYQQIIAADGWFTSSPYWSSPASSKVDGVSGTYTFGKSEHQDPLPSTLRGVWLQSSVDGSVLMPDISWDFGNGPSPAFPVLVTQSGGYPYDEDMPWTWYNNSINGNNRATLITVTEVTAVPEPETYAMLVAGIALVGWAGRRQRRYAAGAARGIAPVAN